MAALRTYTAYYPGIAFAASKNMAGVVNASASEILKIRRIGVLNTQTAAVTGVACQLEVRMYGSTASLTTPTTVTPTPHDSTNTALGSTTCGSAGTIVGSLLGTFRRVFWSSDEPAISTATADELECFVPLNIIFDAGYGDGNVQPMVLRQNQMCILFNNTGAAGLLDTWIEFTAE